MYPRFPEGKLGSLSLNLLASFSYCFCYNWFARLLAIWDWLNFQYTTRWVSWPKSGFGCWFSAVPVFSGSGSGCRAFCSWIFANTAYYWLRSANAGPVRCQSVWTAFSGFRCRFGPACLYNYGTLKLLQGGFLEDLFALVVLRRGEVFLLLV